MIHSKKKHSVATYLTAILGVAFVLRFVGIWYGLPDLFNSDEPFNVANALSFGAKKSLEPAYFVYPTFYPYVLFGVYSLYFVVGKVMGTFPTAMDFAASYFLYPTGLFWVGRLFSVILGTATVWLTYRLGARAFSKRVGLMAAALLALSFTHVDRSHWVLLEPAVAFMSVLALLLIFRFFERGTTKSMLAAGLVCGLATSTKYNAGVLILPLLVVLYMRFKDSPVQLFNKMAAGLGAVLFGFLLGSPYWLASFAEFADALRYTVSHVSTGMVGHVSSIPLVWPFLELILQDWTVGLVFVAGAIYGLFQRDKRQLLLLVFVFPTLLIVGLWNRTGLHYLFPILPALAVLAAVFVLDLMQQLRSSKLKAGALILLLLPALARIVYEDIRLTRPDSRTLARKWIETRIPYGSSIGYENYVYGPNLFDPRRFVKNSEENSILPLALRERLLLERNRRPSYVLVNLRKDFKTRIAGETNGGGSVSGNPYLRQMLELRLPRLSSIKRAGVQYLIASSDNYERYFEKPAPKKGTPLWFGYQNGKRFYESVLNSPDLKLLKEFRPGPLSLGPVIRLYQFRETGADGG